MLALALANRAPLNIIKSNFGPASPLLVPCRTRYRYSRIVFNCAAVGIWILRRVTVAYSILSISARYNSSVILFLCFR